MPITHLEFLTYAAYPRIIPVHYPATRLPPVRKTNPAAQQSTSRVLVEEFVSLCLVDGRRRTLQAGKDLNR